MTFSSIWTGGSVFFLPGNENATFWKVTQAPELEEVLGDQGGVPGDEPGEGKDATLEGVVGLQASSGGKNSMFASTNPKL